MSLPAFQDRFRKANRNTLRLGLLLMVAVLSFASLVLPIALRPSSFPLKIGDVSAQDIQAPHDLTYASDVLTEIKRTEAESGVPPVYLPADPGITRRQIESLRNALAYITAVRADSYASLEEKYADLAMLKQLDLDSESMAQILGLSDARWEIVQQETLGVLEQVMRNTIREPDLRDARRNVPTLISFSLTQEQAQIVSNLVTQLIAPNSLLSQELTDKARAEARETVQSLDRTYIAGETIVSRGQVLTALDWEALEKFNLVKPPTNTQDMIAAGFIVALNTVFIGLYFVRRRPAVVADSRSLLVIALTFLLFLFSARLVIPNRAILPYIFPLSAFGLTIASLFTLEIGLVVSLSLGILAAYGLPYSLDLTLFYVLSSICGVLILGRARRIASFFWAGIGISGAGAAIILAYRLPDTITDWIGIATLVGSSFLNGMAAASLSLLLQYFLSQLLGLTTALQLLEVSRPDHPLLQFILRSAPGTYQHSLQVANLAEQAAEAIGADGLLVRVGAIFHDAGKAMNPSFFIENQLPGRLNPHDDLDPRVSSQTIISHVSDGVTLAKKHRLPPRLQDFMREHHGTLITRYQYSHAVKAAGDRPELVNIEDFRYPGPAPRSKETALLMLADGCEARARSELPKNEEEMRLLIRKVFDFCQREGQLDNTSLTLRDLNRAADSFTKTLLNTHHPRIRYPELQSTPSVAEAALPFPSPAAESIPTQPQKETRQEP